MLLRVMDDRTALARRAKYNYGRRKLHDESETPLLMGRLWKALNELHMPVLSFFTYMKADTGKVIILKIILIQDTINDTLMLAYFRSEC